jgi:replicative DNA helicase
MATSYPDKDITTIHTPPNSKEAEDSIIGSLLMDNSVFDVLGDVIGEEDFYSTPNRLIYQAIRSLINDGKAADVLTVYDYLSEKGQSLETGGIEYLNSLAEFTPSAANVKRYAEIVRDRSIRRRLIQVGGDIAGEAMDPKGKEAKDLLDEAQSRVLEISEQTARSFSGFQNISTVLAALTERLRFLQENAKEGQITGTETGFIDLDRRTSGMHEGQLIIVAGRPAMGKTAFALNIAQHVAVNLKLPVAVFSMEMTAEELSMRLVSSLGRINATTLRNARFTGAEWSQFFEASQRLKDSPIFIDETSGLSILNVRSRARQLKNRYGQLGLIVVDYLQLMTGERRGNTENRATEISEISRGLKGLAKELKVPIIALSQLNRLSESRTDKRPMVSDLRESGAIEQDADVILLLHRPWVYDKTENEKAAEVNIGKQRSGPTGTIPLVFEGEYTTFHSAAQSFQEDENYIPG